MDSNERSALSNREMLFTLLTAIVKSSDIGEIRISEDEIDAVTKKDLMMMYYDKDAKEIILSLHLLSGPADGIVF